MADTETVESAELYCDLEAEEQLLAYLAFTDYTQILNIDENIFFGKDHKVIFNALKKIRSIIPKKLFSDTIWRKVGTSVFEEISATVDSILKAANPRTLNLFETLKKDLQDLYIQRELVSGSRAALENAKNGYIDDALGLLKSILITQVKNDIETGDYIEDADQRIELIRTNSKKTGNKSILIPTGIIPYDKLSGGIQKGEVGVVIAETGGGKSVTLANFGLHAYLMGYNVHFFGYEMRKFENQFRVDSALTAIPASLFRFATLEACDYRIWEDEIKKLRKERKNYFEFSFVRGKTISELLACVEAVEIQRKAKADLVIVDYLTLVENESRHRDFHMQQRDTFMRLSDWAVNCNKAVWTASQSTDEGIKRKDGMRTIDIKYARAIAEFAQIIIAMYQGREDEVSGKLTFAVRKGRGFKKNEKIVLKPDFAHMIIDQKSYLLNRGKELMEVREKLNRNKILGKRR